MKTLSVLIPVYNEETTIYEVLDKVNNVQMQAGIELEIIVINDKSTDTSENEIKRFQMDFPETLVLVNHPVNKGKGGAIHSGMLPVIILLFRMRIWNWIPMNSSFWYSPF